MGVREKLQREIADKEDRIYDLEQEIIRHKAYVDGLQGALRMIPKEPEGNKLIILRKGSDVAKARDAIQKAGHPLYITDLLAAVGKDPDNKDHKTSLSGSLAAYVRDEKIFTRPEPNTFGLIERNGNHPRSVDSGAAQVDSKQEREGDSP